MIGIEETNMKTEFLADAGDLLGRYGLIGRDDWYSHNRGVEVFQG
jgi:hypothetical protein